MEVEDIIHGKIKVCTIIKWMDKRPVTVLTIMHKARLVPQTRRTRHSATGQEVVNKPIAIVDYKKLMGGVDKSDQFLSYYTFHHKNCELVEEGRFPPI